MSETAKKRPVILVADDDEDILALVSLTLGQEDHEILAARDGVEALEIAIDCHPDVLVLDLRMPRLTGHDVLRMIREKEATSDTRVIVLSAYVQSETVARVLEEGADSFMSKPFDPAALRARVENVLASESN
jgi:two-component system, OmpR family, KDP operon response regulator KdpE